MARRVVWSNEDLLLGVTLIQTGIDRFTVIYGKEIKAGLPYREAAAALGGAIMHALACDGVLDNREPRLSGRTS